MDITLKIAIIGAMAVIVAALIKLLGDLISKGSSGGLISTIIILILAVIGGGAFVLYLPPPPTPAPKSTETAPPITQSGSVSTPVPTAFTSANYGALLYEDNFDEDTGTWDLGEKSSIKDGKLIVESGGAPFPILGTQYTNFILEVNFQYLKPTSQTFFAVYFRESQCNSKLCGYQVWMASDGLFGAKTYIDPVSTGTMVTGTVTDWLDPNYSNRLTIIAKGEDIKIYLNRQFIGDFEDSTYIQGNVHLDADNGPVAFDYVRIYEVP